MENKPIYQLNPLIEAQKSFDVMETRIFYLGLQDVNPHISAKDKYYDTNFPDTLITPAELKNIFGHGQYIKEIDKATDRLIGRYITIRYANGFDKYAIFQHIRYKEGKGLSIKFNEDMRPFILDIYKGYRKYGFTKIEMQQIFFLGSAYAMRILELLLQYKSTAKHGIIEREISVEDLRKKLNVPEQAYKGNMSNLRQRVLDLPIRDINKRTQYYLTYKTIKKGRCVSGFLITCNCNKVTKDNEYKDTIDAPSYEVKLEQEAGQMQLLESPPAQTQQGMTEEQQAVYDRLVIRGITKKKAENIVKAYDIKRIKQNMEVAVKMKDNAKNLPGLIITFIENDVAGNAEAEKKEAEAREERKRKERRQAYDDFHGTTLVKIGKKEEEKTELKELTNIEVEMIKMGKTNPIIRKRMERLGLTEEDVKEGKRK